MINRGRGADGPAPIAPIGAAACLADLGCAADQAGRRAFSRTLRSLTVMRYVVGGYPAGGERSRQALNGKAHASAACAPPFRPVHDARDQAQQRGESQRRYPPDARN
jgi:hypothetical protein